jgi:uncharacterized membrane-anchored protein
MEHDRAPARDRLRIERGARRPFDRAWSGEIQSPKATLSGVLVRPRVTGLSKVPLVTALFWVIKILSTALGEATSDYLVHRFNPYLAVIGGFLAFVVALALQFRAARYVPWVYWLAVVMVAVFGTMAADVLHIQFGVPYILSTLVFAVTLAIVFTTWHRVEGTLSIHSIYTRRREAFYWAAVVATFAMGTAVGDLAAYTARLGFLPAGLLFALLFAIPGIAYRFFGLNAIFAFWFAYVLTRPLGASFADWLGKSHRGGGRGLGDGPVAFVLTALIVALVGYLTITGADRGRTERGKLRTHIEPTADEA